MSAFPLYCYGAHRKLPSLNTRGSSHQAPVSPINFPFVFFCVFCAFLRLFLPMSALPAIPLVAQRKDRSRNSREKAQKAPVSPINFPFVFFFVFCAFLRLFLPMSALPAI